MTKLISTFLTLPLFLAFIGCEATQTENSTNIIPQPVIQKEASKPNKCELNFTGNVGSNHKLIFPVFNERINWNDELSEVQVLAKTLTTNVNNEASGLKAYVNGYDDWIEFNFSSNKFSKARERHNNKARSAPFSEYYLTDLSETYGKPHTVTSSGAECLAIWDSDKTKIKAKWRHSEWFVDIYYEPTTGVPQLDFALQKKIWTYYVPQEGALGQEKAIEATSIHFNVTKADVFAALVSGVENNWALLPAKSVSPINMEPLIIKPAPGRNTLPLEDRRSYDTLVAKGWTEEDAKAGAKAVRQLCEAGGGKDCS